MTSRHTLQLAFENVAGHIANLDEMQNLVREMVEAKLSVPECIDQLESKMTDAEVTLVTDIRILINELHHMSREKSP
ncbi:MAG: hypothetical protein ACW98Y_00895 [Candidatus Thorarchaeota archaeon]|jgi:hypothetical protein